METIRPAKPADFSRLAEIEIFNYRLNFYPIFRSDAFYFDELQVPNVISQYESDPLALYEVFVCDDGVVKGFIRISGSEIKKLFVEPVLQGQGIGEALLWFAVEVMGCNWLWALEKNERAIRFYRRHGFVPTGEKEREEDTEEYLIRMEKKR